MKSKVFRHAITLGVIAILAILAFGSGNSDPDEWKTKDNSTMAWLQMQAVVKKNLKSPSSAKFPSMLTSTDVIIESEGSQTYRITSYVESQNSFGAMIRTSFTGRIQQISSDDWKVLDLKFK